MPGAAQRPQHAERVAGPAAAVVGVQFVERELDELAGSLERLHRNAVVVATRDRRMRAQVDRERQHVAAVVVGVLADQIDPAGR